MNILKSPYLRDQRDFPRHDLQSLANQVDHAYIDIASKVNLRTISLFASGNQIITGEKWYIGSANTPQQTIRQVFTFTSTTAINHGIIVTDISQFTKMYGVYQDNSGPPNNNWYGLIPANTSSIPSQISFYISPTQIVFVSGAGAPTLSYGTIVLEWMADF
jgi:hypothetical protein